MMAGQTQGELQARTGRSRHGIDQRAVTLIGRRGQQTRVELTECPARGVLGICQGPECVAGEAGDRRGNETSWRYHQTSSVSRVIGRADHRSIPERPTAGPTLGGNI
jgi:hypothetical protein